jgi:hypothetical protein
MKRTILAVFAILFLFAQVSKAQTSSVIYPQQQEFDTHVRVLAGVEGGSVYGNDFLSLSTGLEVPFAKRFEADTNATFTPLEHKIGLGYGTAYGFRLGGIIWVLKSVGINGSYSQSSYVVTHAAKSGSDVFGGITYRTLAWGNPVRFNFDYVRQVNNHIACNTWNQAGVCLNGTEANYLQGGDFGMTVRMGSAGPANVRMVLDVQAGRVLNQGNPQCDGTFGGPITCQRTSTMGGGASLGVVFEFPRHRDTQDLPF